MRITKKDKNTYCVITNVQNENFIESFVGIKQQSQKAKEWYAIQKLGQLEDIEERLSKYKEIGIDGLVDLFKNLTDEDIEYVVQLAFKKRKIIYDIRYR